MVTGGEDGGEASSGERSNDKDGLGMDLECAHLGSGVLAMRAGRAWEPMVTDGDDGDEEL